MNVMKIPATQMQLARILRVLTHALANLDSLAMELTVRISMNAIPVHVILMQHVQMLWDRTHAVVTPVTLAMVHTVKISMNAANHPHPAT